MPEILSEGDADRGEPLMQISGRLRPFTVWEDGTIRGAEPLLNRTRYASLDRASEIEFHRGDHLELHLLDREGRRHAFLVPPLTGAQSDQLNLLIDRYVVDVPLPFTAAVLREVQGAGPRDTLAAKVVTVAEQALQRDAEGRRALARVRSDPADPEAAASAQAALARVLRADPALHQQLAGALADLEESSRPRWQNPATSLALGLVVAAAVAPLIAWMGQGSPVDRLLLLGFAGVLVGMTVRFGAGGARALPNALVYGLVGAVCALAAAAAADWLTSAADRGSADSATVLDDWAGRRVDLLAWLAAVVPAALATLWERSGTGSAAAHRLRGRQRPRGGG